MHSFFFSFSVGSFCFSFSCFSLFLCFVWLLRLWLCRLCFRFFSPRFCSVSGWWGFPIVSVFRSFQFTDQLGVCCFLLVLGVASVSGWCLVCLAENETVSHAKPSSTPVGQSAKVIGKKKQIGKNQLIGKLISKKLFSVCLCLASALRFCFLSGCGFYNE